MSKPENCPHCGAKKIAHPLDKNHAVLDCGSVEGWRTLLCQEREERQRIEVLLAEAKEELNWQNHRNSRMPTRGGFEFYINEEWTALRDSLLDEDCGFSATIMKKRFDPDDERVRVRKVIEDDAILSDLKKAEAVNAKLRELLEEAICEFAKIAYWREADNDKGEARRKFSDTAEWELLAANAIHVHRALTEKLEQLSI